MANYLAPPPKNALSSGGFLTLAGLQKLGGALYNTFGQPIQDAGNFVQGMMTGQIPMYAADEDGRVTINPQTVEGSLNTAGLMLGGSGFIPAERNSLRMGIKAYHGSPHDFDRFDLNKIGTGEGAQAYGPGLYFAEREGIAKSYRDALSSTANNWSVDGQPLGKLVSSFNPEDRLKYEIGLAVRHGKTWGEAVDFVKNQYESKLNSKRLEPENADIYREYLTSLENLKNNPLSVEHNPGKMYEVDINADPAHFLDWDKPLQEQPEILAKLKDIDPSVTGEMLHQDMLREARKELGGGVGARAYGDVVRKKLLESGVPGIKYFDASSRSTSNAFAAQLQYYTDALATAQKFLETARANKTTSKAHFNRLEQEIKDLQNKIAATQAEAEKTRNYVVFDDKMIEILRKYGLAGALAGGSAYGVMQPTNVQAGN